MVKRIFDIVCSATGLILLLPVMLVVCCAILAQRDGPILFRQVRIGRGGAPFTLLKFRTMRERPAGAHMNITVGMDSRITPIGHVLRRTKIDEFPQFWNVLRGDMSIVGPRPESPEFVRQYPKAISDVVLSVRPGITDMASIKYRNEAELLAMAQDPIAHYEQVVLPDKLAIAAQYVRSHTFFGDIRIIFLTVFAVIWPDAGLVGGSGLQADGKSK